MPPQMNYCSVCLLVDLHKFPGFVNKNLGVVNSWEIQQALAQSQSKVLNSSCTWESPSELWKIQMLGPRRRDVDLIGLHGAGYQQYYMLCGDAECSRAWGPKVYQAACRYCPRNVPWDLIPQHYNKTFGEYHFAEKETVFLKDALIFPEPHNQDIERCISFLTLYLEIVGWES